MKIIQACLLFVFSMNLWAATPIVWIYNNNGTSFNVGDSIQIKYSSADGDGNWYGRELYYKKPGEGWTGWAFEGRTTPEWDQIISLTLDSPGEWEFKIEAYEPDPVTNARIYGPVGEAIKSVNATATQINNSPSITWNGSWPASYLPGLNSSLSATASDSDGNLASITMEISLNGGGWSQFANIGGLHASSETNNGNGFNASAGGSVQFRVIAFDSVGADSGWIYSPVISVESQNSAPSVSWVGSWPSTVLPGALHSLQASANDVDGNLVSVTMEISRNSSDWEQFANAGSGNGYLSTNSGNSIGVLAGDSVKFRVNSVDQHGASSGWNYSPLISVRPRNFRILVSTNGLYRSDVMDSDFSRFSQIDGIWLMSIYDTYHGFSSSKQADDLATISYLDILSASGQGFFFTEDNPPTYEINVLQGDGSVVREVRPFSATNPPDNNDATLLAIDYLDGIGAGSVDASFVYWEADDPQFDLGENGDTILSANELSLASNYYSQNIIVLVRTWNETAYNENNEIIDGRRAQVEDLLSLNPPSLYGVAFEANPSGYYTATPGGFTGGYNFDSQNRIKEGIIDILNAGKKCFLILAPDTNVPSLNSYSFDIEYVINYLQTAGEQILDDPNFFIVLSAYNRDVGGGDGSNLRTNVGFLRGDEPAGSFDNSILGALENVLLPYKFGQ
tara:strand:+ start:624 stop:2657 length:2034 start_codon:yes stop_codon:yes gene_type:complete